ncbi:MAG: hypothetical protein WDO24_21340 [Pseudomonadota bacterium]
MMAIAGWLASGGAAGAAEEHYSGKAPGTSKNPRAYCMDLRVDISINERTVAGAAKRFTISPKGNFVDEQQVLTGVMSADGTGTLTLFTIDFPVTVGGGKLVGKFVGRNCDYDFNIPRSR